MKAFAKAMFDQLRYPDRDVTFHLQVIDGPGVDYPCRDLLHVRPEEQALIRSCLAGKQEPRILDIACGLGRHSAFASSVSPHARITLVETNEQLRDYCLSILPGAIAYEQFDNVPAHSRFDVAFLMCNGLGVFGSETATRCQLQRLFSLLVDGASVLIEAGNFGTGSFYSAQHEIEYGGSVDGPFTWSYATREWLQQELVAAGFAIISVTPSISGGRFFICHAQKSG
ncbi:MAG TPA: class I SAM-dependent methyltransferase [Chthoniobacterales bacterium]|nr:class I SAM-dependent methyltransferase [Chthoniobacterales bacterium]